MRVKHYAWIPVAWLLSLANLAAVWFAARSGETWHATTHALLAAGFAIGALHVKARRQASLPSEELQQALDDNERLQQTIEGLHSRVFELEERVDMGERLLARHRDAVTPPLPNHP